MDGLNPEKIYGSVIEQLAIGVLVIDERTGRTQYANPEMARIWGMHSIPTDSAERQRQLLAVRPDDTLVPIEELESASEVEIVRGDESRAWVRWSSRETRTGEAGKVRIYSCQDVTAFHREETRAEFLDEASHLLANSFDLQETLETIGQLAVQKFRGWCAISLLGPDNRLHDAILACRDPARLKDVQELRRRYLDDPERDHRYRILETRETWFIPSVTDADIQANARDSEHAELLRKLRLRALIQAPLVHRGKSLGVFALGSMDRPYDDHDRSLLEKLAERTAMAIENGRLYRDIKIEREALRYQESQLRLITDAVPALISYLDRDLQYRFVNARYGEWFNINPDTLVGKSMSVLLEADEFRERLKPTMERVLAGEHVKFEGKLNFPRGGPRNVLGSYIPHRDSAGGVMGIVALVNDITEKVESEERYEKSLRNAIQVRDDFLSIASHELKTPVTSLKLQLQIARRSLRSPGGLTEERLERMFEVSIRQVDRLSTLVEDLLDVSRIGAGQMSYHFDRFDFTALVAEVVDRYQEQFRAAGSSVTAELEPGVDIEGDRFRVEQVIVNLITNAIKYGSGKPVRVVVSGDRDGAVLSVHDQGIGIAPDKQERIFGRFERAVSHKNISGLGLGLFITRQIVDAHGGRVEFESQLGRGSVFTVFLPARAAQVSPSAEGSRKPLDQMHPSP